MVTPEVPLRPMQQTTDIISGDADFTGDGTVNDADVAYLLWHTLFPEMYPL